MRAVVAPMIADRTFFEAIPGLMDALARCPAGTRQSPPPRAGRDNPRRGARRAAATGPSTAAKFGPAVAPTIPHHCSDEFIRGCAALARDFGVGLHSHVAESKVQALAGIKLYGKTLTAHLDELGILGPRFHRRARRLARQ